MPAIQRCRPVAPNKFGAAPLNRSVRERASLAMGRSSGPESALCVEAILAYAHTVARARTCSYVSTQHLGLGCLAPAKLCMHLGAGRLGVHMAFGALSTVVPQLPKHVNHTLSLLNEYRKDLQGRLRQTLAVKRCRASDIASHN